MPQKCGHPNVKYQEGYLMNSEMKYAMEEEINMHKRPSIPTQMIKWYWMIFFGIENDLLLWYPQPFKM